MRNHKLRTGAQFDASIEHGDYPNDSNMGMMALHFAVRVRNGAPSK